VARDLILAVPVVKTRKLNVDKLKMIRQLLDGEVGKNETTRNVVLPSVIHVVQAHLPQLEAGQVDEPYLCIHILQAVMDIVQTNTSASASVAERTTALSNVAAVLPELLQMTLCVQQHHFGERGMGSVEPNVAAFAKVDLLVDSMSLVWTLLHILGAPSSSGSELLDEFLYELAESDPHPQHVVLKSCVARLLTVATNALRINLYPEMWVTMIMLQFTMVVKCLERLPYYMQTFFLAGETFAEDVWRSYFSLALGLLAHHELQLEKGLKTKAQFIMQKYGDVRDPVIRDLRTMWGYLDAHQLKLTGLLVPKLLELARTVKGNPSTVALDLYFDLLAREFQSTGSFKDTERHTIVFFYDYIAANHSAAAQHGSEHDQFLPFLVEQLETKFRAATDLAAAGAIYLRDVQQLYDLMSSLLKFPETALYEDERTATALHLMDYLEKRGGLTTRREMYCRYVQNLIDLHVGLKNHTEAGMTTLQHIRMYEWDAVSMVDALVRCLVLFVKHVSVCKVGVVWSYKDYRVPLCLAPHRHRSVHERVPSTCNALSNSRDPLFRLNRSGPAKNGCTKRALPCLMKAKHGNGRSH
jgi:hypothetical protein